MTVLLLFCALIVAGAVCIVLASQADRRLDETLGDALDDDPAAFRNNVRVVPSTEHLYEVSWTGNEPVTVRPIRHDAGPACALCGGDHTPASAS